MSDGSDPMESAKPRPGQRHGQAIILIGLMGTGKTTVGRIIARQLQALHIDTDGEIERRENMPIAQIFAEKGEQYFRDAETNFLRRLTRRKPSRRLILSTGGGLPLRPENATLLKRLGAVVWLRADADTLVKRVERKIALRPLLSDETIGLHERMSKLCAERDGIYSKIADHVFDTELNIHASVIAASVLDKCDH
jgi:shikimate kinase